MKMPVEWSDFHVTNAIVIALERIAQAESAPALLFAPLTFASLMLINAVFFQIAGAANARTVCGASTNTAVIPFFPGGMAVWWRAGLDGVLHGPQHYRPSRRRLADGLSCWLYAESAKPAVFSAGCRRAGRNLIGLEPRCRSVRSSH